MDPILLIHPESIKPSFKIFETLEAHF